jgi:LysM repeat protein
LLHFLSDAAAGHIMRRNALELHALVTKYALLEGVAYAFIQDGKENIVAQSLGAFPSELRESLSADVRRQAHRRELRLRGKAVYETRVPILGGQAGTAHIGIWADGVEEQIRRALLPLIAIILTLLAAGMAFSILLARGIIRPILRLTQVADKISVATTRALLKSKPDLARDFMRAYIEGIHYGKTHRKETLDILAKYLRTDDKEVLEDTYESILLALIPEKPYPTQKGIQVILRELGAKDSVARSAKPEQFVDLTVIKELDSSGFIDRVYKPAAVAKVTPRSESTPAPAVAKPVAPEEKAKPAAKQVPTASDKAQASAPAGKPGAQEYTVKAGDTLSHLALRFYGSSYKWDKIYQANARTLKNPDYLYVRQQLLIPADETPGT